MSDATTGAAASDSTVSVGVPAAPATPVAATVDAATAAANQAVAVSAATDAATAAATAAAEAKAEALFAKVKALLVASGHDVEIVFDDLVAIAKKVV